ncbi:MaoC/PaaZ C-terminal domain-containing protein [Nonomuraea sp. NPDC048916]|uniref:MaoC/PaaZ C-terminal domain-containing protein n=1 Tax=Nonomuraea sp. NPDC048916 TaxID=3154232 RepID=UPI0033FC93F9
MSSTESGPESSPEGGAASGYRAGDTVTTKAITVTETHLVSWASLTGDWLPIHTDREYAARSRFGQRIAHGPLTLALALGLSTQTDVIDHERTLAWLGMNELRALAPVLIGDTIKVVVKVADVRPSKREGQFVVSLSYTVVNQSDEDVMTFDSVLLVAAKAP